MEVQDTQSNVTWFCIGGWDYVGSKADRKKRRPGRIFPWNLYSNLEEEKELEGAEREISMMADIQYDMTQHGTN